MKDNQEFFTSNLDYKKIISTALFIKRSIYILIIVFLSDCILV